MFEDIERLRCSSNQRIGIFNLTRPLNGLIIAYPCVCSSHQQIVQCEVKCLFAQSTLRFHTILACFVCI